MNGKSISRITRTMFAGLFLFMSACSSFAFGIEEPTLTALPATPTKAPIAQQASTSTPVVEDCLDTAQYLSDDGLDGTTYAPNTPFTKTWTVKNTGSCTWDSGYMVFQISGAFMTQQPGYWIMPQGMTVSPGQSVNISVGMTSPTKDGKYASFWGLKNWNALPMPIQGGVNGNSFSVNIAVNDGIVQTGQITTRFMDTAENIRISKNLR